MLEELNNGAGPSVLSVRPVRLVPPVGPVRPLLLLVLLLLHFPRPQPTHYMMLCNILS